MSQEPSWDLYRTFNAVLSEGSLSGAARALGLTQPSIARHIDALEEAVGAPLFLRTSRGLSPTDAALELRPFAELMASTSAALLRTAEGRSGEVDGTVRISASEVVGIIHLPAILTRLRQRYPRLTIELSLSNAVDDLLKRQADIAIRMVRPEQQTLIAKRVGSFPVGLHAHRDYLARRGTPKSMDDLKHHDIIGYDAETPAIRAFAERHPGLDRASFALRVDSNIAHLTAIRAGFGIGICQTIIADAEPDLQRVLPDAFHEDLETWVVMHEDLSGNTRCRAVFDALVTELTALVRR
ncbi:LysR family transcriptional regulator [Pleomorphomonas oryzae]|uniref:LysR family transcriptional regulator n=1 Tax=Pleomorphomonas oryzae TaxID=261934 RepID=UPI00040D061C|nr:LysR family transcriptional regulator [Pleomorphomonas oryzae]